MTAPRSENGAVPDLHASAFADEDACASTRTKNARRILLLGNFGSHNLGNEGSLEAMLDFLREAYPAAEIACACWAPDIARSAHGIEGLQLRGAEFQSSAARLANLLTLGNARRLASFLEAYRTMRRFDVVIVPGTGILDDFREAWHAMPYALLRWSVAARLARRPLLLVCIGAGPITHPVSRHFMLWAARLASFRSYRDPASRRYMASIGLDVSRDPVVPDIAFRLPAPAASPVRTGSHPLVVGVGIMAYRGWTHSAANGDDIYDAYIAKMAHFVGWLLEQGHAVRLVIGERSDAGAVSDVAQRVGVALTRGTPRAGALVSDPASSLHDLMRQLSDTDIVVATRYHNVVCALRVGKPVISLGYAAKHDELQEAAGLGDFCQHVETLDVERLKLQFACMQAARAALSARVAAKVEEFRRQLRGQEQRDLSHL
ncbi:MAG: polysaccharide pyruvyl transferase family protein [Hyphomicrobiaceae bacterium]